jgi:hypothetical protein
LELPEALPKAPAITVPPHLLLVRPAAPVSTHTEALQNDTYGPLLQSLAENGIVVEELTPARLSRLTDRLQQGSIVDVLHFGGDIFWKDGKAYLQFEDRALNTKQAAALLAGVPLIVLGRAQVGIGDETMTSVASMISMAGALAVVGMQFTLEHEAEARFAEVMYTWLARGESLGRAVTLARQALYIEYGEQGYWYCPVLYLRSR